MVKPVTQIGHTNFLKTMLGTGKVVKASGMKPITYAFGGANHQLAVTRKG